MKFWVLLSLLQGLLSQHDVAAKRFDPFMVDPLMRRSSLDKNFMRFGRSSPPFNVAEDTKENYEYFPDTEASKNNVILLHGRGHSDNFMRFGRGKQDNFMRFGRSRGDSFMRFGRGKHDSYMRFGRGNQDNFIRFGRGKQDNFMRLGRGKQDNFMRFGRKSDAQNMPLAEQGYQPDSNKNSESKQKCFLRVFCVDPPDVITILRNGRAKPDNFNNLHIPDLVLENNLLRNTRGKQDSFIRFGRNFKQNSKNDKRGEEVHVFRTDRAQKDGFMRFGKSIDDQGPSQSAEDFKDYEHPQDGNTDKLFIESQSESSKENQLNPMQTAVSSQNKDSNSARFDQSFIEQSKEISDENEMIPQRLKRSVNGFFSTSDDIYQPKSQETIDHIQLVLPSLQNYLEEEIVPSSSDEDYNNQRKRSVSFKQPKLTNVLNTNQSDDHISVKQNDNSASNHDYHSSLISAGFPNVIVGPEFSLLPDLDPPLSMQPQNRPGNQNFLRLG